VQNSFPSTSTADRIITSLTDDEETKNDEEEDPYRVRDTLGRMHAPFPQEDERMDEMRGRRRLHSTTVHVPHLFNADFLWDKMYTGKAETFLLQLTLTLLIIYTLLLIV